VTDITRTCRDCSLEFVTTAAELEFLRATFGRVTVPSRCQHCRLLLRRQRHTVTTVGPDEERICAECGASFVFTSDDQEFCRQRAFVTPRRCRPCRKAGRAAAAQRAET